MHKMISSSDLKIFDISHELWREYEWGNLNLSTLYKYRINKPQTLFIRPGGTTHRVVDSEGIVHCVPSVGIMGCVLRWKTPAGTPPVNF